MDAWKKANVKFCTANDLNARDCVKVNRRLKRISRKIARQNLKLHGIEQ